MAIIDDFSFPKLLVATANNSVSQFSIPSQSIWRKSSLVYPDNDDDYDNDDKENDNKESERTREAPRKHKSFSEIETGDSETRMDRLWQDFNERELKRVGSLDGRVRSIRIFETPPDHQDQSRVCKGLNKSRVSKGRTNLVIKAPRRTTTVAFLRALRKLFYVHNFGRGRDKARN